MKLTEDIEVNGVKEIVINGSRYYRYYYYESFRRYENERVKYYSNEYLSKRIRGLLATGKWRIWIHDNTINVVEK